MVTLGQDWFKGFNKEFQAYALKKHYDDYLRADNDTKWTNFLAKFLTHFGRKLGYTVTPEYPTIKRQRFDMHWEKPDEPEYDIVLEYETDCKTIFKEEIPKLKFSRARLNICITYVPDKNFSQRAYSYAEALKKYLEEKKVDFQEFLLIVGGYEMNSPNDWVCYRFHRTVDYETIFLPSSAGLLEKLQRAGRKEQEKRQEKTPKRMKKRIKIVGKTKGKTFNGILINMKEVRTQGKLYKTPSGAAKSITGYPIDGWHFWKFKDSKSGKLLTIDHLR